MREISTLNVQAFKIAPDHEGGTVETVTINPGNISPAKKKGKKLADPEAHLLIGFDTDVSAGDKVPH